MLLVEEIGSIAIDVVGMSLSLARSGRPMAPRACCRICCFSSGHDSAVGEALAPSSEDAAVVIVTVEFVFEFEFEFVFVFVLGSATATLCDCRYACMPASSSAVKIGKRLRRRTLHVRVDVQDCSSVTTESTSSNAFNILLTTLTHPPHVMPSMRRTMIVFCFGDEDDVDDEVESVAVAMVGEGSAIVGAVSFSKIFPLCASFSTISTGSSFSSIADEDDDDSLCTAGVMVWF